MPNQLTKPPHHARTILVCQISQNVNTWKTSLESRDLVHPLHHRRKFASQAPSHSNINKPSMSGIICSSHEMERILHERHLTSFNMPGRSQQPNKVNFRGFLGLNSIVLPRLLQRKCCSWLIRSSIKFYSRWSPRNLLNLHHFTSIHL